MAVNFSVQADVVDINTDTPRSADIFFVDSNVWFWLSYPTASHSAIPYQLSDYPKYVNNSLAAGSKIYRSGLSFSELCHRIEKTEHEIYCSYVKTVEPKEYRHNFPAEHLRVFSQVEAAWGLVKSMANSLPITIDDDTTDAALNRFKAEKVDGYDLFMLEAMKNNAVVQIITDDGDFVTVPGIQVFTANKNVLSSARNQGKLLSR